MPADSATLRFHGELNWFLPEGQRGATLPFSVGDRPAVKHPIETLGVPHPEVAGILVNGAAVDLGHRLEPGDAVEVFPQGEAPPQATALLRPLLPRPARFVLDTHLGRLAAYLRLLGVDAWYRNDAGDALLATVAADGGRVLLSRDRGLLKRSAVIWGYCPRSTDMRAQLISVIARYDLRGDCAPGSAACAATGCSSRWTRPQWWNNWNRKRDSTTTSSGAAPAAARSTGRVRTTRAWTPFCAACSPIWAAIIYRKH
jgi:hypothetical protein